MKTIIMTLSLLLVASNTLATDIFIQGVNTKWITQGDWKKIILGAATSITVHEYGHYLYLKTQNKDGHFEGLSVSCTDPLDNDQEQWFSRSGFVLQVSTSLILSLIIKDSDFVKGFCAMTSFEVISYPIRRPINKEIGDLALLDKYGSNWELEYALYSTGALTSYFLSFRKEKQ